MNNKLKLAISPSEEMWNKQDFRDLVKEIAADEENTELYIITDNTDAGFIDYINETTGLESDHIFIMSDIITLTAKLIELSISLFLCDTIRFVNYINNTNPMIVDTDSNTISGTQAILIDSIPDVARLQPKYITQLTFWTDQIKKYNK